MGEQSVSKDSGKLKWWQLSLLGVAGTIGTGYFLGSGLAIMIGGPAVLIAYLLAAAGTYVVFDALARMTADHPEQGSFRSYAQKAFGGWAGFGSGYVYWCSELLIMGSQLTALSIFSRFWFPSVPMWIFAAGFGVLSLIIVFFGNKGFDKVENVLAVIKMAAILMFLIIAASLLAGWIDGGRFKPNVPLAAEEFFSKGGLGLWSSFIFAFYAYGGIEVLGIMSYRLRKPEEAPKAGKIMLLTLAAVYALSIALAVTMVPQSRFNPKESPFVLALGSDHLAFVPHVFNGVLIVAGFSTMTASLYAVTSMMITLAQEGDAPGIFSRKLKDKYPLPALGLIAAGLGATVVMSLLMPGKVYEYITTAAGLMLLYNWSFILLSSARLLKPAKLSGVKRWCGLILIIAAVTGTVFHHESRPGLFISLLLAALIAGCDAIVQHVRGGRRGKPGEADAAKTSVKVAQAGNSGGSFRIKGIRLRKSRF
ncbi:L-asparagine transporter-like permease [Paenibacillus forsythiae]|uniref:L-asparagine transporter-like permease n=1 Tax=Paenibacillus forsythiae TaxID=365616 RepID=A0ABU3H9Y7_9BACL|nr:amino acid permease [Paenibacillus forsythiae]MDT3427623.1 L-asparagine transporter-like permease [Paenibacillus forsythiae]